MPQIKLAVVEPPPEGSTATVLLQQDESTPVVTGHGETADAADLMCGKCGNLLAGRVRKAQYRSIVLYCRKCGSYNTLT